jgi:hypothetical protein
MEEEKKSWTKEEIIKLFAIIFILLVIFLYSVFSGNGNINKNKEIKVDLSNISELFKPIDNNYTLIIDKTVNNENTKIEYITDGTLKLYDISGENEGYIIYNDKTYVVDSKKITIKEYNKKLDFINDRFYNIDFIKSIMNICDIEVKSNTSFKCSMDVSSYIANYNEFFHSNYIYLGDEQLVFNIKHGNIANNINVDYSVINNIITGNQDKVEYNIKIENVNNNDYSNLFDVFSDTLKK